MSYHLLTKEESEIAQRARREAVRRAWLKPHLTMREGKWVCYARGTQATALTPQVAYSLWVMSQQQKEIYATGLKNLPPLLKKW